MTAPAHKAVDRVETASADGGPTDPRVLRTMPTATKAGVFEHADSEAGAPGSVQFV